MISHAIEKLLQKQDLSPLEMEEAMLAIMTGKVSNEDIFSFLDLLSSKGESPEELASAAKVMRQCATKIKTKHKIVLDTCGTGGDNKGTFNVSTASAFVASGAGIAVAKHGNRSASSKSGSADVLEAMGFNINMSLEKSQKCLDELGIVFLFAQNFHPAMKYASEARKKIAKRTIFNLIGPLSNPAGATHQMVGVYDRHWVEIVAKALSGLGSLHSLVVHSDDGLDEISTGAKTFVCEETKSALRCYEITPEDLGFKKTKLSALHGAGPADSAKIILDVLEGKPGAPRDIVVLNSAAAIYAADKASSIKEGIVLANESIDSGRALDKLELLREYSLSN